jgi:putative transposase
MPRMSRAIAIGYPHHITQRGNYRQTVFAEERDYARYVELIAGFSPKYGLEIWAYCLMPNHVHFVGVPGRQESLARTFNTVHMLYAQYFNRKRNATGHLWQGRFYSCVLDERHLYAAVRYVEMNPVRGGIVQAPQDYPWCSAKSHMTGVQDQVLSGRCFLTETVKDWGQYLGQDQDREATAAIVKATKIGRPCGKDDFVQQMEGLLDRRFTALPRGRRWKKEEKKNEENK